MLNKYISHIYFYFMYLSYRSKISIYRFRLLLKMGWQKDTGLGSKAQGIKDPVRVGSNTNGSMGLGKNTEFAEAAVAATQERRKLRSEQLLSETKEESEKRREEVSLPVFSFAFFLLFVCALICVRRRVAGVWKCCAGIATAKHRGGGSGHHLRVQLHTL